jgi:hypothetical protein
VQRAIGALALVGLTACAVPGPALDRATLPLHVRDQVFSLDYRLIREPDRVSAVGLLDSSVQTLQFVHLRLLGVTVDGRVVSHGYTTVDGTFRLPAEFSVQLRPTGTEVRFELQAASHGTKSVTHQVEHARAQALADGWR